MPTPEKANSDMWVRPIERRAGAAQPGDGGRVAAAGASRRIAEPAAVVSPATSNRSLIETARPASAPGSRPAAIARSARRPRRARARKDVATNAALGGVPAARSSARSARRRRGARDESPARFGQVVGHRNAIISRFASSGRSARLPVFMGKTSATGRGSRSIREPASSMVSRRRIGQPIQRLRFEPDSRTNLWKLDDDHDA
jgi:hypothetical protein